MGKLEWEKRSAQQGREGSLDLGISGCLWRICWEKKKLLTERVEDPHWSRAGSVFEALTGSGVGAIPALLLLSVPHSRALCQLPPRGKHSQAREAGGG